MDSRCSLSPSSSSGCKRRAAPRPLGRGLSARFGRRLRASRASDPLLSQCWNEGGHRVSGRTFRSPPEAQNRPRDQSGLWPSGHAACAPARPSKRCLGACAVGRPACCWRLPCSTAIWAWKRSSISRGSLGLTSGRRRHGAGARHRGAEPSTRWRIISSVTTRSQRFWLLPGMPPWISMRTRSDAGSSRTPEVPAFARSPCRFG